MSETNKQQESDNNGEKVPLSKWKYSNENDHLLSSAKSDNEENKGKEYKKEKQGFWSDALDTLYLAIPIFISQLSWVGMTTVDTSLLGHVGSDALAAQALSDLWTMCTGILIQGRVLGIICGQAVGAKNFKLSSIYLQVSLIVLGFISIIVFVAWSNTTNIWLMFGESETLASQAGYYAFITSLSIPAQIVFSQLSQFLFAQRITKPQMISSISALLFNLVFGLYFVLGYPLENFSGYGFLACPVVTTLVEYVNVSFLCYFFFTQHDNLWYGWEWKEITKERILVYVKLYVPSAFGLASDFWRMGLIGIMAARIGALEVAVFNTSYRIMWITLTCTGAISGASGIKMGMRLGSGDYMCAKQAGNICVVMALILLTIIGSLLLIDIRSIGKIFSNDDAFLDLLNEAKIPFVATLVLMNLACAIEKIPISMGRTSAVFWIGMVGSWLGQVPGVLFLTTYWRDDLVGLYSGMAFGYCLLTVLYFILTVTSDWKKYSDIARKRAEITTVVLPEIE